MKINGSTLALIAIICAAIAPSWNTTIAELADKYDDSLTTRFQPDIIIQAWGDAVVQVGIAIFAFYNRNQKSKPDEN